MSVRRPANGGRRSSTRTSASEPSTVFRKPSLSRSDIDGHAYCIGSAYGTEIRSSSSIGVRASVIRIPPNLVRCRLVRPGPPADYEARLRIRSVNKGIYRHFVIPLSGIRVKSSGRFAYGRSRRSYGKAAIRMRIPSGRRMVEGIQRREIVRRVVDYAVGDGEIVRVPKIAVSGGIFPQADVASARNGRGVGKGELVPVRAVGSGVLDRFPRSRRRIENAERRRSERLSIDEAHVGKIAVEISVRTSKIRADVLRGGRIEESEVGILPWIRSRKAHLIAVNVSPNAIGRRRVGRIHGYDQMVPCRRIAENRGGSKSRLRGVRNGRIEFQGIGRVEKTGGGNAENRIVRNRSTGGENVLRSAVFGSFYPTRPSPFLLVSCRSGRSRKKGVGTVEPQTSRYAGNVEGTASRYLIVRSGKGSRSVLGD